ncbi:MAG: VCBS repeat-containing protein, partial [Armatimonadetes bacterium]
MNRLRILALAIAVTAPSADARQQVLYEIGGAQPEDQLGRVVSGAGDVNADGFSDFVLGGHLSDRGGRNAGLAEVYSGINGSILYTYTGSTGEGLGYVVSDVGDMDHDGHDDFALSSPYKNVIVGGIGGGLRTHAGMVDVRSGRDGSRIRSFAGSVSGMVLGRSMSGAGDTNNDGYPDIVFGSNTGVAWIHSGRDGIVLTTLTGIPGSSGPGLAVSSAGDFNGDGFDDVTGGDFAYQGFDGLIQVFSGLDGSELSRVVGSWP